MNYHTLKTRYFLDKTHKQPNVNRELLIDILGICYKTCSFSTLPYFMYSYNSEQAIQKTNSGNCIALSMFIQNYLKTHYNIVSYLIPCTIPTMYKRPKYLDISHVSLAVPKNNIEIYVLDAAFYFYEPLLVNITDLNTSQFITSVNIYSDKITPILSTTKQTDLSIEYNAYQQINKGTVYSECYYMNDWRDKWCYYLTEILNPDEAISSFFLQVVRPFITTTYLENDLCKMDVYLKYISDTIVEIKIKDKPFYYGEPHLITKDQLDIIRDKMRWFYDDRIFNR